MLKNFLFKQLLKSKLKDIPKEQQDKIFAALEENPKLFEELAHAVQEKMKQGKDQMAAVMEAAREREAELKTTLGQTPQ